MCSSSWKFCGTVNNAFNPLRGGGYSPKGTGNAECRQSYHDMNQCHIKIEFTLFYRDGSMNLLLFTLYGHIKTVEQRSIIRQYCDWYTGRWWAGCNIWYSKEGLGRAAAPPILVAVFSLSGYRYLGDGGTDQREILHDGTHWSRTDLRLFWGRYPRDPQIQNVGSTFWPFERECLENSKSQRRRHMSIRA